VSKQPISDNGLALKYLEEHGWSPWLTEHWTRGGKRRDLFNGIDAVALIPGSIGILGVQVTTREHHLERERKILKIGALRLWVGCGNRLWVMSRRNTIGTDTWRITQLRANGLWIPATIWKTKVMDGRP
jgi:hypothetical protein